jgi:DNA-directed RNA polymerase specialized sigma24 family protein
VAEKPDPYDREIRRLLAGTEAEIREALARIFVRYTKPMCGWIRRQFRWFPPEDMADAWQNTLLIVLEKALKRQLDTTQKITPFVWTVFRRRCCDILEQGTRCKTGLEALRETLADEGQLEGRFVEEGLAGEWAVVFHVVDKAVLRLPRVQRMVWMAYRELGYSATDDQLLRFLRETQPDKDWTKASVRRAKQEGRKKLRRILQKRGYVWPVPTNPSSRWA